LLFLFVLFASLGVARSDSASCTSSAGLDVYGAELLADVPGNSTADCCRACHELPTCRGAVFRPETRTCSLVKSWAGTVKHPTRVLTWPTRGLTNGDVYVIVFCCACLVLAVYGCCVQIYRLRRGIPAAQAQNPNPNLPEAYRRIEAQV
jgi:hypothetical protein